MARFGLCVRSVEISILDNDIKIKSHSHKADLSTLMSHISIQ